MRESKSESSFRWTIIPSLRLFYASQKNSACCSHSIMCEEKNYAFFLYVYFTLVFFGIFYGLLANHFAQLHLRIGSMGTVYSIFFSSYICSENKEMNVSIRVAFK